MMQRLELDRFFQEVQLKALRQAQLALANRDDAMDVLQEAMIALASRYAQRQSDWPALFQRILQNKIRDCLRRRRVQQALFWWQSSAPKGGDEQESHADYFEGVVSAEPSPQGNLLRDEKRKHLWEVLQKLPFRQQQAFILRAWWDCDTRETAFAMQCSEGSVKTHYSRALARLRELLGEVEYDV